MRKIVSLVSEKTVAGIKIVKVKIQHPQNKEGYIKYVAKALNPNDLTTWYVKEVISWDGTVISFEMNYKAVFLTSKELIDLMLEWKL